MPAEISSASVVNKMSSDIGDTFELQSSNTFQGTDSQDVDDAQLFPTQNSHHSSVYETRYQKSLRHYLTREALPKESHYRNLNSIYDGRQRPTLDELHDDTTYGAEQRTVVEHEEGPKKKGKVIKFGWMEGVLMRCMLNIWGVMLFLRLTWVVGEAGLIFGLVVILAANFVTVISCISMSAVATNGQIKAGGIYYMISRSLGPEFGGSIGLMFTLANSIAASTYIIGFVDSLADMCEDYFGVKEMIPGLGGGLNDVRVIGVITLILVLALAIVGMDWVTRVQMGLLFLLIGSQINFLIGAFLGPLSSEEEAKGFIGFNSELFNDNMMTDYRPVQGASQNFFSVFGVFFPAVTGIVAGANLSGDLKDPGDAIPKGTLLAILITGITYIGYPFIIASTVFRDATGNVTEYEHYKELYPNPLDNPNFMLESETTADLNITGLCELAPEGHTYCEFGTQNSAQVMELISAWGPLIYFGTFAATLSSAIASLVGAPRVLQALAKDKLYPLIHVFEKGHGANNDPFRGYFMVFILSFLCIMIGDLNAVSTLLTNFFLAAYALINFSCFHASLIKSPGWRPAFTYYNCWVSLIGGILCLIIMFFIDWITALITFLFTIFLYMYVSYRKPDVNWGSSTQAQVYISALKSNLELVNVEEHVKNYRPQILVLSGHPRNRPPLVDFAHCLTKSVSFLSCGDIMKGPITQRTRNILTKSAYKWMSEHKTKAFYSLIEGDNLEHGAKNLFQLVGLGKLRPNMVLLGYKSNWETAPKEDVGCYFNTLHEALDMYLGIAILRVPGGLDFSKHLEDSDSALSNGVDVPSTTPVAGENTGKQNSSQLHQDGGSEASSPPGSPSVERTAVVEEQKEKQKRRHSIVDLYRGPGGVELPKDILSDITRFHRKQKKATIDVWWLYDDGGLTLLLPYILTTRSQWAGCKLRVFALANRKDELDMEQRSMANLLNKFRIDFSDMIIIPDMARKASSQLKEEFEKMIKNFKVKNSEDIDKENDGLTISEAELLGQREKTNRHIRLRELLLENSRDSSLIVMTLPMPRKNSVSAPLYLAWLEMLTKDMPPFLLIRGNQTSVLTFYS